MTAAGPDGAAPRRERDLQIALAIAQAEAAELRARLATIESSTSWRATRPLRAVMAALRPRRPLAADLQADAYAAWIRCGEAACRAALPRLSGDPAPGRMGLVLLAPSADAGTDLARLLATCPPGYAVLVLGTAPAAPPGIARPGLRHLQVQQGFQPHEAVGMALTLLDCALLAFLDMRDRLAPDALAIAADMAEAEPPPDLLFADEDWLDARGRRGQPFLKPGWDRELQRGRDLVGPFAFFRTALLRRAAPVAGPGWRYDLANQVAAAARPGGIRHIPAVLCHRTVADPAEPAALRAAAALHLQREGIRAEVTPHPDVAGWHRVRYALPDPPPLVSLIVPTRDRAALLRTCAEGILRHTAYPRLELLVVDNDSTEPAALALLQALEADPRVRVLRAPGVFNWSALNNGAAARAAGTVLVLLNNDIAVLDPGWLTELVSQAVQPGVGAVGAKLLYPDGRIQHAGLTTDRSGAPRHLLRHADGAGPGPFGLMGLARQVWGVTGACLAIPRAVFDAVGGLDESLPVANNDVDLCLRLAARGYRIVWSPWCRLRHHEMATRAPDHEGARRSAMRAELVRLAHDWGERMRHDPFLNPNLELVGDALRFRAAPDVPTP